ncbi:MAG: formate dehydrogenase accessory protein FdhE [Coriobacteriia bacterium]|nr:formate dehydrogenase accessory protein FdhE [Coriobacteriia bacterium]
MNIDLVSRAADAYLQTAESPDAARLRFLEGLWDIQYSVESVNRPYTAPESDVARDAIVSGQPLFFASPPEVPIAEYVDTVSRIAHYASEMAGLPAEQASALRDADFAAAIDGERLATAVHSASMFAADVTKQMGAEPDGALTPATVAFVLISALVPFLTGPSRAAMESLGEFDGRAWPAGRCPICGEAAALGRMGESTQLQGAERTLWCGLCHGEWGYERIRCVRCGTRSPGRLRYNHVEGDAAHRVHLCEECHGYAKFVFTDDLDKPLSMVVEDAMTTTLDAVALSIGYTATGDGGAGSCRGSQRP